MLFAAAERDRGAVFPPVTVFLGPDGVYRLADGFHRLEVARQAGRTTIAAEVREGGFIDALKVALLANVAHGLRRTAADKHNAVMIAYKYRLELGLGEVPSPRAVADAVGVGATFAGLHLSTVRTWREFQAHTGADGKTYSLRSNSSGLRPPTTVFPRGSVRLTGADMSFPRRCSRFGNVHIRPLPHRAAPSKTQLVRPNRRLFAANFNCSF